MNPALNSTRPRAAHAFVTFVDAMQSAAPTAPTRCSDWTVHELTAHLAAGSAELADLIELELAGAPPRPTLGFEEREAPYRRLPSERLRTTFVKEALRATVAIDHLVAAEGRVEFTGSSLDASALELHVESELVLHRWDLAGEDAVAVRALSDSRFAIHAATTVAQMSPNVFPARFGGSETIALRTSGSPDISVSGGPVTTIGLAPLSHSFPVVECHPAVRTLMLWGRCPGAGLPDPIGLPCDVEAVVGMLRPAGSDW